MDSDILNEDQPRGYCAAAINGTSPNDGAVISNWYHRFCTLKPDVACMVRAYLDSFTRCKLTRPFSHSTPSLEPLST